MRKKNNCNQSGFTLIEMAVVLVIIGLIIGAVTKGQDLIQSAKQKKFYTQTLKAWELAIVSYYDRTGNLLGDGTANGGVDATSEGHFDTITSDKFITSGGIVDALKKVGIVVPDSGTPNPAEFTYRGKYSGTQNVKINFFTQTSASTGKINNVIAITGIPTDLAIALDKIVDEEVDATKGKLRQVPDNTAWPDATTTATVQIQYILDI